MNILHRIMSISAYAGVVHLNVLWFSGLAMFSGLSRKLFTDLFLVLALSSWIIGCIWAHLGTFGRILAH